MDASPDETPSVGSGTGLDSPILAAALRYAEHGIAVFPARLHVRGNGKKGVRPIEDWDAASTTDPQVIRSWFAGAWSDAALCIDCGKSGLVGIDQDVTDGYDGVSAWEALNISGPVTWRVRSPTGGRHDYYRADPEHPFTVDNTGAVAPGVDVRGMGGFLFAPPSIDPRGGAWQWIEGEPDWAGLPMVPEVVVKRMENRAADRRPKVPDRIDPAHAQATDLSGSRSGSQLFGGSDFGPAGGYKTETSARALLSARLAEFASRTTEGNARSHFLAQDLGVLAGHGVGVFWTYEDALATLLDTARGNGMVTVHGLAYVTDQARRGLEYGMRQPWVAVAAAPASSHPSDGESTGADAEDPVAALLAEMLKPSEVIKRPPPRPLIRGLLNLDSESWIIGAPGSKKSFVALDMAAHVALGIAWQGMQVTAGRVVMIVAEGAGGLGPRLAAWQIEHKRDLSDDIYILPRPVQAANLSAWAVLREACRRIGPVLVVLDTQARVTVGLEENSATEMGVFTEAVRTIREATGACVLTVHHTGRQGGDARGSSAIDGAQHTELKVISEKGSLAGKLISEKQKDMALADDVPLSFVVHETGRDETGQEINSLAVRDGNAFTAAEGRERPEVRAAPPEAVARWVERILVVIVKEAPRGVGWTRADIMRGLDDHYGWDMGATMAKDWRTTKEAYKYAVEDPRTVSIGMKLDVEDLETRERIESDLGRNGWGQNLGSNDRSGS